MGQFWIGRGRMGVTLNLFVFARWGGDTGGDSRVRVSSVAIRAAETHGACRVHGWLIGLGVTRNASRAFVVGFLLRLAHQAWTGLVIGSAQRRHGNSRR